MNNNYIVKKNNFIFDKKNIKIPNFYTERYKEKSENSFNRLNGEVSSIYDGYCEYKDTAAIISKNVTTLSASNDLS